MKSRSRRVLCLTVVAAAVTVVALAAPSLASAGGVNYVTPRRRRASRSSRERPTSGTTATTARRLSPSRSRSRSTEAPYTSAYVTDNGSLQLLTSDGGLSSGCSELPINGFDLSLIPYQGDLRTDGANDGIFTTTTGSAPHRQFVIEWRTTYFQSAGNGELRGHPARGLGDPVSVIYGQTADSGSAETSGIQASDNGPSTQFSCGETTLPSGLRVNYVPSGCPAGSTLHHDRGLTSSTRPTSRFRPGRTVCWTNNGQVRTRRRRTPEYSTPASWLPATCSRSPSTTPGRYPYHCVIHGALMTGLITVNTGPPPPHRHRRLRRLRRLRHLHLRLRLRLRLRHRHLRHLHLHLRHRHLRHLRHRSGAAYRGSSVCVSPPRRRRSGERTARSATCDASALAARCGAAW